MTKPLRVALVGIGKIARDQHIPAIRANPDLELAAAVSRNATIDGIENFKDVAAMLAARPDIDMVSLCTPPQGRYEQASAVLAAGRHLMLEKPPGTAISECNDLAEQASGAGLTLFATWHSRYAVAVADAKAFLADARVHRLHIEWKEDVRRWHPGQEWIWQPGGLGVFDPGINALSILTEIYPQALRVTSAELEFPANRDTPVAARLNFSERGDAMIGAEFDWRQQGPQSWNITAETDKGAMQLTEGGARLAIDGEAVHSGRDHEYPELYRRSVELVRARQSDADFSPLIHVADAFLLGKRVVTDPFEF
jgi:D-galactose 1-dehydrogenase